MITINFAKRNFKEIIRDPLSIIFAILLPLFLLLIFTQFKIPNDIYKIENFTPGILIFSLAFITMFTSILIAKDRSTSLLIRLRVSPMKPHEYIIGYTLSVMPLIITQNILLFSLACFLGLKINLNILYAILICIPVSIIFISLGIIIGLLTKDKSAAGASSIIVQLVAFTSGMYFPSETLGTFFNTLCNILPFKYCLDIIKGVLNNYEIIDSNFIILILYLILIMLFTIFLFKNKLKNLN